MQPKLEVDHRVVAPERGWVPVDEAARCTIDALRSHGCDRPVLVGHSAGAELAALVAASGEVEVRGLVLESPVIGAGAPAAARAAARLPGMQALGPPVLRAMVRVGFGPVLRAMWSNRSTLDGDVVDGYRRPLLAPGVLESMWTMTAEQVVVPVDWEALADVPCLVVRGDRDRWATAVAGPLVREVVYERCGHLPHEEDPDQFVDDVAGFLAREVPE